MRREQSPALAALAFLAACGGLESPDLTTGTVQGRVLNAAPSGGYAYALGAPESRGTIAADGSFRVDGVPAGAQQLVVVAQSGGLSRAELAPVDVAPAMRTTIADRDASAMALSGRIVVAARPAGGSRGITTRFTVEGTEHQGVPGSTAILGHLPAGNWALVTNVRGFHSRRTTLAVVEGLDADTDEPVDIDDGDANPGCASDACSNGLHCNPADGACYPCLSDGQCGSGETCDPGSHTCIGGSGDGTFCDSASSGGQCTSGVVVPVSGGMGYCSLGCPSGQGDCPAGSQCLAGVCQVPVSCLVSTTTFGSPCVRDDGYDSCTAPLYGGRCLKPSGATGFCSATCTTTQNCTDGGLALWTCKPYGTSSSSYCQP